MIAFKLFRVRKDGTLGSLFINKKAVLPTGKWLNAETHETKGFVVHKGWHCLSHPAAPHLSMRGRTWACVEVQNVTRLRRPAYQGGEWLLAKRMKITCLYSKEQ